MDQPFAHTLSFDDLEVLVLVEDGGATPREVTDSLGMELEDTKALFYDLMRRGLLACQEESTTFLLTPLARSLRSDEAFSAAAFAAMSMTPPRPADRIGIDGASTASLNGGASRDASTPVRYSGSRLKPCVLNCWGSVPT